MPILRRLPALEGHFEQNYAPQSILMISANHLKYANFNMHNDGFNSRRAKQID